MQIDFLDFDEIYGKWLNICLKILTCTMNLITVWYRCTHHWVQTNKTNRSFLPFLPRDVMKSSRRPADCSRWARYKLTVSLACAEGRKSSFFLFQVAVEWKLLYIDSHDKFIKCNLKPAWYKIVQKSVKINVTMEWVIRIQSAGKASGS